MATAFCPACQKTLRWSGTSGARLADRRCRDCGGPLKGASSREMREFEFRKHADEVVVLVRERAAGIPGAINEAIVVRSLASWAMALWPKLRAEKRPARRRGLSWWHHDHRPGHEVRPGEKS
jgi:hypothetical protein